MIFATTNLLFKRITLLTATLLILQSLPGQDTTSVLFIGNSYTYFWNLPQLVGEMAEANNEIWITRQSTAGGSNLGQHWNKERGIKSQQILSSRKWDFVIIQDHSLRAIESKDSLDFYTSLWIERVKSTGAQPILYMTWARKYDPTMTDEIASAYEDIAAKHQIPVVPVGRIWAMARSLRPDIELYDPDGSHPSTVGAYLTACAFYSALSKNKASGLPERLLSTDYTGEKLFLMVVSKEDAQFCQSVTDKILMTYGKD